MSTVQIITGSMPVAKLDDHISPDEAATAFECGCEPTVIVYQSQIHAQGDWARAKARMTTLGIREWDTRLWDDDTLREILWTVDTDRLRERLRFILPRGYIGHGMLDWEAGPMWPGTAYGTVGDEMWQASMHGWNQALDVCHDTFPGSRWGIYNAPYVRNNAMVNMQTLIESVDKVRAQTATLSVDQWYPSIYDRVSGPDDAQAENTMVRIGLVKSAIQPNYAVVTPRVLDPTGPDKLMSTEEFERDQLDAAINAGADGVAIWIPRRWGLDRWTPDELSGLNPTLQHKLAHLNGVVGWAWFTAYRKLILGGR